jgi:hypothetical protein
MKSQKLRAQMPTIADHAAVIPAHKMSETLLAFGEPLFALLGEDAPLPVREQSMKMVITVWNAGAMAMPLWGQPELLRQFEQTLEQATFAAETAGVLKLLLVRRREVYGSDPRAVGEWGLRVAPDGTYVLHCAAHLPSQGNVAAR